jgi:hypothetical protein
MTARTGGASQIGDGARQGFDAKLPATPLGTWSVWLAVAFVVMFAVNMVFVGVMGTSTDPARNTFSSTYLPFYGISMFAVGFVAGIVGLVAIIRQKERSLITLLTLVPTLFVTMFLIGEFLVPH